MRKYPWVQLAGHSGNFQAGTTHGTVQKKLSVREETCYRGLMKDEMMRHLVPQYYDTITLDDDERETLTIMASSWASLSYLTFQSS